MHQWKLKLIEPLKEVGKQFAAVVWIVCQQNSDAIVASMSIKIEAKAKGVFRIFLFPNKIPQSANMMTVSYADWVSM